MISCETAAQCERVAEVQIELVTELLIPVTVGVVLLVIIATEYKRWKHA